MKTLQPSLRSGFLLFLMTSLVSVLAVDSAHVKKLFKNPPREYSTGPLWVWNDLLTDDEIRTTMRDLANQKVKQVWVHPRPGLMTPYLSEQWFHLWQVALQEAGRLDMNVWIYDENSYPSGFAGGWVPELMPESRGQGLSFHESKQVPQWDADTVGVFRLANGDAENVSPRVKAGEVLGDGRFLSATIVRAANSPWTAGRCYVNLLTPGVTEKFLDVTLEAYRKNIGDQFGKRVPGVFTDEPNIRPAGGLPWCDDLPEQFQKRWGYNLLDNLASLSTPVGDWRKVRFQYFSTLNGLFIERWSKPYHDYCDQHDLEWTGHYWDHEWPRCGSVPDNMAMYAWHQRPAIDCLMNQYAENTHAQFGNVRMVKELSSVANQLGLPRTLCETYGAGGWDLRFEDMKRIGDWLSVLGVNTINQHLDYVTIRGARKRDHPQSFSYHEPWWDAYHVSAEYLARLSVALAQGAQTNHILVLEPTTTAWMYQGDEPKLQVLGDSFFNLLMSLEAAQIEYDLGCEDVIARHGSVAGNQFRVGQRSYDVVVLPPHTENLDSRIADLGEQLLNAGGKVVCLGETPSRLSGIESSRMAPAITQPGWISAKVETAVSVLGQWNHHDEFQIHRAPEDRGILFHQRRQLPDGQLLFLVNTSIEHPSSGEIVSNLKGVQQWDPYTGTTKPYSFHPTDAGVGASFKLPPSGSLLLFLSKKSSAPAPAAKEIVTRLEPTGQPVVQRLHPNVLTLDYVDITAGGETLTNSYFYPANQFAFQKNGMPRDPWDSAVQFKDELLSKKFPADSSFTASYKFTIASDIPKNLAIVIERPDLYTITCNGKPVAAEVTRRIVRSVEKPSPPPHLGDDIVEFKDWWLDKSFGKISIADLSRPGENVVTIKASPFTIYHELEPAYLLGDFTLKPVAHGFIVEPDQPLQVKSATTIVSRTHAINPEGTMWITGGIGFNKDVDDRAPFVVFDLGGPRDLGALQIWNYCESHVADLTSRGAKRIRLSGAGNATQPEFNQPLGEFTLKRGNPNGGISENVSINAHGLRFVRLEILSKQDGVTFPAAGQPKDNGFVGLAEVQFIGPDGRKLDGVKIQQVSSELPSHLRLAKFLIDGSGLLTGTSGGWDSQGHPFYSAGVAYLQKFEVTKREGRFAVALPQWLGSVAKVSVNGKLAGYIDAPPWECDVTEQIKRGANTIEVTVIGTLKNTLGPHHGNPKPGTAWPGMFHAGPNPGPPAGLNYSTVGYGLFAPFQLRQFVTR